MAVFLVLLAEAIVRPITPFDRDLMMTIQDVEAPRLTNVVRFFNDLTDSTWAVVSWVVVVSALVLARWWPAAATVALLPSGGVVNAVIGQFMVARTRPHLEELARTSSNMEEHSFPSGHVMGAVLLYGLLVVFAQRIRWRTVRLTAQSAGLATIVLVGFARVWWGAHWPSDVIAAYALGLAMLCALVGLYRWLDGIADIPAVVRLLARGRVRSAVNAL